MKIDIFKVVEIFAKIANGILIFIVMAVVAWLLRDFLKGLGVIQ